MALATPCLNPGWILCRCGEKQQNRCIRRNGQKADEVEADVNQQPNVDLPLPVLMDGLTTLHQAPYP